MLIGTLIEFWSFTCVKNFNEVVIIIDKYTLVEVHAAWCGHCKKLTPIFEEVVK